MFEQVSGVRELLNGANRNTSGIAVKMAVAGERLLV